MFRNPGFIIYSARSLTNVINRTNIFNPNLIKPVQSLFTTGSVIISNVNNIYDNLSLEEWIYRNYNFSLNNEQILLLWKNKPAVVVGRHQNVWLEANINYCRSNQIDIARRNSGGGTVYHDENNLNISFLTSRKCYNRERNLKFIKDILHNYFQIEATISPRKDLIIKDGGQKISGTASKLNSFNSYHHCTLIVNVDRNKLRNSLSTESNDNIQSNATKSIPSPVINLNTLNSTINIDSLIEALSTNYGSYYSNGNDQVNYINRIETNSFMGVDDIQQMFRSWNWIFGATPKFTIRQQIIYEDKQFDLEMIIQKGIIDNILITSENLFSTLVNNVQQLITSLFNNVRFEETDLKNIFEKAKFLPEQEHKEIVTLISLTIYRIYTRIVS